MKTLAFSLDTQIQFSEPVTQHSFALRFLPRDSDTQHIRRHQVALLPHTVLSSQTDGFGNLMLSGYIDAPHSAFAYKVEGLAEIDLSCRRPTAAHPMYRYGGSLTRPDGALKDFVAGLSIGWLSPQEQAKRIHRAVSDHFVYTPGVTSISTTAAQSFALGRGVCQDYAQVMVTLCRCLGLAARYCAGYTVGEGASHAWVEVCLPEGWVGFDPTRDCMVDETYLRVAVGRDYADCPLDQGVFRGLASQTQTVFMRVQEVAPEQAASNAF